MYEIAKKIYRRIRDFIKKLMNFLSDIRINLVAKKVFLQDVKSYKQQFEQMPEATFEYLKKNEHPCMMDRYHINMLPDSHYFLQDIVMANRIIKSNPHMHYDVGSSVSGFNAHLLSAGVNVTLIDIRPMNIDYPCLFFQKGNGMDLKEFKDESIQSLSSLHAIEHFGLGRYGDPIDPMGWKKGLLSFQRVLAKGGILYLGTPIGPENKLCFNAHRIFHPKTIVDTLDRLELVHFSYIKNYKIFEADPMNYLEKADYCCGLFVFRKPL